MTTSEMDRVAPTCAGMRGWRRHLTVALIVAAMLVGGSVATSASTGSTTTSTHGYPSP